MAEEYPLDPEGIVGLMLRMRSHGITDPALLKAVEQVPHQQFVPVDCFDKAWQPKSLPIACGQTMHSPDIVVRMISALAPGSSDSVLEIGTGSGYQTAILAKLAKKVHSLDRYQSLLDAAEQRVQRLGLDNITFAKTDGQNGSNDQRLYDRIIADCAYETMPRGLLEQMTSGGVVVTAIGEPADTQMMVKLTKVGSRFDREDLFEVRFGPFETGVADYL